MWARNHPDQVFCKNFHIKFTPKCPQADCAGAEGQDGLGGVAQQRLPGCCMHGLQPLLAQGRWVLRRATCAGSMEAAELLKPRKPAEEEEPPEAPPPPQPKPPKQKKQPQPAAQPVQQAAAGVPRKAVAAAVKASAAPRAQLGGSASLGRTASGLSQSSSAGGGQTFAQQQLAEARAAAAAARAQLAAAKGGRGVGAAGAQASASAPQLTRAGSAGSAASSAWTRTASAFEPADEYEPFGGEAEEEEEAPAAPPPRAPTPDFSQEAWPDLGGGPQRGGSNAPATAAPAEHRRTLLSGTLAALEAEEEALSQQAQEAQQQHQLSWEPAPPQPYEAAAGRPGSGGSGGGMDWAQAHLPPPAAAAAAALALEEEPDAAALAALLRQQQEAFQRQLASRGSADGSQPASRASTPASAQPLWEQPAPAAAPAGPYFSATAAGSAAAVEPQGSEEEIDELLLLMGIA